MLPNRQSKRLKEYDYSNEGYYYVTICSKNRQNIFSAVGAPLDCALENGKIQLSPIGQIIEKQWLEIPSQYTNVELDEYVIMPNHIHGLLIINRSEQLIRAQSSGAPTTLGQIIRSFKSRCANDYLRYIQSNNLNVSPKIWQRNYYDHIIRNETSLNQIRKYIENNPSTWDEDENNLTS